MEYPRPYRGKALFAGLGVTLFDWLATPSGQAVAHGLEVLLIALAALISAYSVRIGKSNNKLLNGHLRDHLYGSGDRAELERHLGSPPD